MNCVFYAIGGSALGAIAWYSWDSYMNFIPAPYIDKNQRPPVFYIEYPCRYRNATMQNMARDLYNIMKKRSFLKTKNDNVIDFFDSANGYKNVKVT